MQNRKLVSKFLQFSFPKNGHKQDNYIRMTATSPAGSRWTLPANFGPETANSECGHFINRRLKYHVTGIVCLRYFHFHITCIKRRSPPRLRRDVLQICALMRRSCSRVSCHCAVTGQRWRVNVEEEAVSPHGPHQAPVAYNASVIGPRNDSQRSLPFSWMEERSFTLGRSFS